VTISEEARFPEQFSRICSSPRSAALAWTLPRDRALQATESRRRRSEQEMAMKKTFVAFAIALIPLMASPAWASAPVPSTQVAAAPTEGPKICIVIGAWRYCF